MMAVVLMTMMRIEGNPRIDLENGSQEAFYIITEKVHFDGTYSMKISIPTRWK